MSINDCNYGLWFVDVSAYKKKGLQAFPDRYDGVDKDRYDRFMEVLLAANNYIGHTVNESISEKGEMQEHAKTSKVRIKALSIENAKDITRTSIMVAYYYYFNLLHEYEVNPNWFGYGELFKEFKRGIDPELEKCGYQEVSGKCIFDVLLTFSSYARIVL